MIFSLRQLFRCEPYYAAIFAWHILVPVVLAGSFSAIAPATCRAADSQYLGLPAPPAGGVQSSAEISLGKRLFFDNRLSVNGKVSCATCHMPSRGLADGRQYAVGVNGLRGTRNTPTLWNAAFMKSFFWDGRRTSLALQAIDPLLNPREMGLPGPGALIERIKREPIYRRDFQRVFGSEDDDSLTVEHVARAISSFEETLLVGDSPFDRYLYAHQPHAMSPAAIRGLALFRGRAGCASCHTVSSQYALFTDNRFHDEGVGMNQIAPYLAAASLRVARTPRALLDNLVISDPQVAALGRFVVTENPGDIGSFRTPSLRNVALTAPYMHDGSIPTLRQAVDFEIYYRSLRSRRPLILTPKERSEIVAFLYSLTSPMAADCSAVPRVRCLL